MKNNVRLIAISKPIVEDLETAEELIAYCARVSNPDNQLNNKTAAKLISYCAKHSHWSIFETVFLTIEIECTRDIGRQILRHRSFSFQEFSQRYSAVNPETMFTNREIRLQDQLNRQYSIEVKNPELDSWFKSCQDEIITHAKQIYYEALERGIAKEQARCVLPEGLTMSRMYMSGSLRSWIHYCNLRCSHGTQKEHRIVAKKCREIVLQQFTSLADILNPESGE